MANYSVLQSRLNKRFYAVDLSRLTEYDGRSFYAIIGSIFGQGDSNQAWREVQHRVEEDKSVARVEREAR